MIGFKFVIALALEFTKIETEDKAKYITFYLTSNAETVINEIDIDGLFKSIYDTVISNIQNLLGTDSGRILDSVVDHTINISTYNPLACNSYIKLPKELDHPK